MIVKESANIDKLSDDVRKIFPLIEEVCSIYGIDFVITSGNDGKHMKGSKHYDDEAIDIRSRDLADNDKYEFLYSLDGRIDDEYPAEFDILFEVNHYHLEYDPK